MALDDNALFTAAKGYIFVGPVGMTAPTPAEIASFNDGVFGQEKQTVTITGTPASGTFTLTYKAQTTAPIAYNAAAAAVQSALNALSTIGANGVTVSGGPGPGTPYVVTFNKLTDPPQMTATGSFTGGSTPAVAVTTTTAGWTNLGHTSREDLPEPGFDGGDTETRGTWQNAAVKEVITDVAVDYITFNLHQFDDVALSLYYGQDNGPGAVAGEFRVQSAPTATQERSFLMVIVDGTDKIGFYARKASMRREGSITLGVDEFSVLPMRATFVKDGSSELFRWISSDMNINTA